MDIVSTVERKLFAFTITLSAHAFAHAAPPPPTNEQPIPNGARPHFVIAQHVPNGARPHFVTRGFATARQAIAPQVQADQRSTRAQSRVIYLNRDGTIVRPGNNDARLETSSVVQKPTALTPWDIDDETWEETVACIRDLYARFDVRVTDEDPGDVPHIEAVFGGHPNDVGLPDNVAGVSPFTTDCSVIENSVVFTFTDVLPDDPRLMCEVMAQEIAHSYGLDHEMLANDPMTYLEYDGERTFQDVSAPCGEFGNRPCGIDKHVCWQRQNSVQLLEQRLGRRGDPSGAHDDATERPSTSEPEAAGCSASGSDGGLLLLLLALRTRRSRRARTARCR